LFVQPSVHDTNRTFDVVYRVDSVLAQTKNASSVASINQLLVLSSGFEVWWNSHWYTVRVVGLEPGGSLKVRQARDVRLPR